MTPDVDECPVCGGKVRVVLRGGVGIDGSETWSESGVCEGCDARLHRPIGPPSSPIASMTPLEPWGVHDDDAT